MVNHLLPEPKVVFGWVGAGRMKRKLLCNGSCLWYWHSHQHWYEWVGEQCVCPTNEQLRHTDDSFWYAKWISNRSRSTSVIGIATQYKIHKHTQHHHRINMMCDKREVEAANFQWLVGWLVVWKMACELWICECTRCIQLPMSISIMEMSKVYWIARKRC